MLWKIAGKVPPSLIVFVWRHIPIAVKPILAQIFNLRFTASVCGLVYAKNGDLLIVKHTYKVIPWGLPCGGLKKEQPFECLKREVWEETGFEIEPVKILSVIHKDKPSHLAIIIEAKLLGGLFKPSPEVSDFAFIGSSKEADKLSDFQRRLVEMYFERHDKSGPVHPGV